MILVVNSMGNDLQNGVWREGYSRHLPLEQIHKETAVLNGPCKL